MSSPTELSILLTGAAGFIGSHLGNTLVSRGNVVWGIDSRIHPSTNPLNFSCEQADCRWEDLMELRAHGKDAIVHLAALINVDFSAKLPLGVWSNNVDSTLTVLETARRNDLMVVLASSSEVYGTCQATFINERHPLDGMSPYAASKTACDRAAFAYKQTYGLDVRIIRLFNTYGPSQAHDGYGGVIAKFTSAALRGKPMQIYGNGEQRRDYIYVDDAVEAYLLALSSGPWDAPLNIGTGTTVSINELAHKIADIVYPEDSGPKARWEYTSPRAGEVDCLRCDASKARKMKWEPKVTFAAGLKKYVEWAKQFGE